MQTVKIKVSIFKGYWEVPKNKVEEFRATVAKIAESSVQRCYPFDDFSPALNKIGCYVSAGEIAQQWVTWNYNIPEFDSSNFPQDPEITIELKYPY